MKPLVVPVPNLNGNSAESLQEQLTNIRQALNAALAAFSKASDCIHGRNFQTMLDGISYQRMAQEAWYERVTALEAMASEIYQIQIQIQKGQNS